ncbi:MAG: hypothetical protein ACP5TZ_03270 [Nitrososphaeria archaeon]
MMLGVYWKAKQNGTVDSIFNTGVSFAMQRLLLKRDILPSCGCTAEGHQGGIARTGGMPEFKSSLWILRRGTKWVLAVCQWNRKQVADYKLRDREDSYTLV